MLRSVTDGVAVHVSAFLQSNTTIAYARSGTLLVDPGLQHHELACLADDLAAAGRTVTCGFATHPDWDHLLWHPRLGDAPRYGTARCAADAHRQRTDPDLAAQLTEHLADTEIAGQIPIEGYGDITALPDDAGTLPWDGDEVRVLEHRAHATGHAALLLTGPRVLVAGDMLSDVLVPMLDLAAADPIGDYLTALDLLADVPADVVVPGHGSVGDTAQLHERLHRDRAYVLALPDGRDPDDPRIGPAAAPGWEWVADLHHGQAQRLAAGH